MAKLSVKPGSKGVVALIIVAVVIFFGCVLGYLAGAGKVKALVAERDQKKQMLEEANATAHKLEQIKLAYNDTVIQLRNLESNVSTYAYVPTLLKQLEYLGKSVNLKVVSVRPVADCGAASSRRLSSGADAASGKIEQASQQQAQPAAGDPNQQAAAAKPAPYDELTVDIEVEGSYMNTLDFLYKLTNFPKVIAVSKIEMQPKQLSMLRTMVSPTLNIKLTVEAFILKDNTPVPQVTDPKTARVFGEGRTNENEAG